VTRKPGPAKPAPKTDINRPNAVAQEQESKKASPANEPEQAPPVIEHVTPDQTPRIKATDLFTFTRRTLTAEARELLAKIDEGGIPLMITQNLERIAKENGIEISNKMTLDDIIRRLRKLA
jgi:hypothetical protein